MKIEFSTENAAFDEYGINNEIRKILEKIISKIDNGETHSSIVDTYGNIIGSWNIEE